MKTESISDQKRLVRGEQWLFTRQLLRARDHAHHKKWRVLMIAGPSPAEEIACIRELMPTSHITAIDISEDNVRAASVAGAHVSVQHDVSDFDTVQARNPRGVQYVISAKLGADPFDAICLDLTGPASTDLAKLIRVYASNLTKDGILITTFSYGRDVREAYDENWRRNAVDDDDQIANLIGLPVGIRERVFFLLNTKMRHLRSVLQYRGGAMPMISMLLQKRHGWLTASQLAKFKAIAEGDFESAVAAEDLGNIYACPAERIEALRRSMIAHKAVATRREKAAARSRKYRAANSTGAKRGRPKAAVPAWKAAGFNSRSSYQRHKAGERAEP